jgi:hypothetical protein
MLGICKSVVKIKTATVKRKSEEVLSSAYELKLLFWWDI